MANFTTRRALAITLLALITAACGNSQGGDGAPPGPGTTLDGYLGDASVPDGYQLPDGFTPAICKKDKDCLDGQVCVQVADVGKYCVPKGSVGCVPGSSETCNGKDDDCDGVIDNGTPCSDGNACNGLEQCVAGQCQAGQGVACDDGNICTTDSCTAAGGCEHTTSTAVTCEDGNACTGCILPAGVRSVYLASAAAGCPEGSVVGCNALWLPGFFDGDSSHVVRFDLESGARFDWLADGTAHLTATAFPYNLGDGPGTIGEKWTLSFWFKFRGTGPAGEGTGGPKLDNGWVVPKNVTDSWFYFDLLPGQATMKRVGSSDSVEFTQKPAGGVYPFQVGIGANDKTMAFSSSGWMDWVKHTSKGDIKSHGDLNVDLALTAIPDDCDRCLEGQCKPGAAKDCDDKNDCTTDSCAKGGECVHTILSGSACEDGTACTTGETCNQGKCKPGSPDDSLCEDGNPCTKDHCTVGVGCVFEGADPKQSCDDGDACTSGEACKGKKCEGGNAVECDDGNPCTQDICYPQKGCVHKSLDGASCEDGNACTTGDACKDSQCGAGSVKDCGDDNGCTTDTCDAKKGCQHASLDGTGCDDGNACTGTDLCVTGKCKPGEAILCGDDNPCTLDSCDYKAGCTHKAKDGDACEDGTACTQGDACKAGVCVPGKPLECNDDNVCTQDSCSAKVGCVHEGLNGIACSDGSACTQGDVCVAGKCTAGEAPDCDDKNACTSDSCDGIAGCVHKNADGKGCSDGNTCTGDDLCSGGQCVPGAAIACDDQNGCTKDTCEAGQGCVHTPANGLACSDGDACTLGDACKGSVCVGEALGCDDDNLCTTDSCDSKQGCVHAANGLGCNDGDACTTGDACVNGKCAGKAPTSCEDGNPCTIDSCDSAGGCVHKAADGWKCEDGNACTQGDACQGGKCIPGGVATCDDSNACTADGCSPNSGCWHKNLDGGACSDGDACTSGDACKGGSCVGSGGVECGDGNPCTTDSCAPGSGCSHTATSGTACNDGNACTMFDTCAGGKCVGETTSCTDNNPCTVDTCNPSIGCAFAPNDGLACDDGSACTSNDICLGGKCQGSALGCDDGNPCTTDTCSASGGCAHVASSGPCDDGNACTSGEACADGKCQGGKGPNCDDGNPCTGDSCAIGQGCVHEPLSNGSGGLSFVSDGETLANGKAAVGTWDQHTSWTASIPGAKWIWSSFLVADPVSDTTVVFQRSFNVPAGAQKLSGSLVIAADNSYVCTLNGTAVGSDATEFNYFESSKDTWDLSASLKPGVNVLECTVKNWAQWYGSAYTNPAGLLYKVTTAWNVQIGCSDGNECTVGDLCVQGQCAAGATKACSDGNPCSADSCDPATGACSSTALTGTSCNDGNACTGACLPAGVQSTFQPSSATGSGGHGFWLPGFFAGGTARFAINAAQSHFDLYADKAHLYGTATVFDGGGASVVGQVWAFDIWFKYRGQGVAGMGAGGPKLGVIQSIPKFLTDTWRFFDMIPGQAKLTNTANPNDYAILNQAPVNSMYPFQFGDGANYFTLHSGACSWLFWERHAGAKVWSGTGDMNLDMTPVTPAGTCDVCQAGQCSAAPVNCDDGNPCTADSCNTTSGCVHAKIAGCVGG
jgi:hypothetical protein